MLHRLIILTVCLLWVPVVHAGPLLLATEGFITVGLTTEQAQAGIRGTDFLLATGVQCCASFTFTDRGFFDPLAPLPTSVTIASAGSFIAPGIPLLPSGAQRTWEGAFDLALTSPVSLVDDVTGRFRR